MSRFFIARAGGGLIAALLVVGSGAGPVAGAAEVRVPLVDVGGMVEIPVQAFNQTLYFIVDTGFTITAIDSRYRSYLGPRQATCSAASPLGTKKDVPIYHCPDIAIAGRPLGLAKIACLDLRMLSAIGGHACDGVLGMDWFAKSIVSINFDRQTLTIEEQVPAEVETTFTAIPLDPAANYFALKVLVNHAQMLELMLDTGDSGSLSFNQEAWRKVFSGGPTRTVTATVADAVNQVAQTKIGVVGEIALQGLDYTNLHAMFTRNPAQPSTLGLGFVQRYNVTLDFPGRMLYLQPDRNYSQPDVEDMSGLHLLRYGSRTTVYSVDEGSPAAEQGIRPNDLIEAVNEQPVSGLSMKSIRQLLRTGDGELVAVELNRGGNELHFRLVLRKSI